MLGQYLDSHASLAVLLGSRLRRSEVPTLAFAHVQRWGRESRRALSNPPASTRRTALLRASVTGKYLGRIGRGEQKARTILAARERRCTSGQIGDRRNKDEVYA
jgi:hypothetical protein